MQDQSITSQWREFADMFQRQSLPETLSGELLTLVNSDLALAKVIYGLFGKSSLHWLKNYKSQYLEFKTPLQCIREKRFDLLYPFLMAATATDGEREDLKAALLRGKISLGDPHLSLRKRALITEIIDGMMRKTKASKPC